MRKAVQMSCDNWYAFSAKFRKGFRKHVGVLGYQALRHWAWMPCPSSARASCIPQSHEGRLPKHQCCEVHTTHCAQNPFYMQQCWRWLLGMCMHRQRSMALAVVFARSIGESVRSLVRVSLTKQLFVSGSLANSDAK